MTNIYGLTHKKLEEYFSGIGEKKFKATQIFEWLYQKRINSFDDMSNVSKKVIEKLRCDFSINKLELLNKQIGDDVVKYLFKLSDNNKIEAVLMKHDYGNSLCISTQVGCNMGCHFCESGRLKMGIGEPFDNYDNVINFIEIINHPKGIALGSRHITISTCGLVPKIKEFMKYDKQVNLAVSLHAPNNEIRNKIMNINKVYPIEEVISVIKEYINKTNRRVTFEYIMLKGVNDSILNALELSKLLKGINCYVNLIPYNETSHIEFKKSNKEDILKFYDTLKKNNINVTIRREFGSKVSAACGQLRSNYEEGI